jgi:putative transposase
LKSSGAEPIGSCRRLRRLERFAFALKRQELAGRVFDDEYDLALAIIEGLENRGQQNNFSVERLMFN